MLTGNSLIYGLKNFLPKVKAKIFDGTADSVVTDTSVKWLVLRLSFSLLFDSLQEGRLSDGH